MAPGFKVKIYYPIDLSKYVKSMHMQIYKHSNNLNMTRRDFSFVHFLSIQGTETPNIDNKISMPIKRIEYRGSHKYLPNIWRTGQTFEPFVQLSQGRLGFYLG